MGTSSSVEDTVRHFWATRPRRPKHGRKIAGVAAGIARRYDIDPVLVRVVLVVMMVYGGAGLLLYLLGWLLLPKEGDEASPAEAAIARGHSSTSLVGTVILGLALIPVTTIVISHSISAFLAVVMALGGMYLLHRHRGGQEVEVLTQPTPGSEPAGGVASTVSQPVSTTTTSTVDVDSAPVSASTPSGGTPPEWDPLGVAPFAWDLPDPTPVPSTQAQVRPPRRSPITLVTLGLALVAAGVAGSIAAVTETVEVRHVVGIVLAVLGLGMVAGSFLRGGRGLIGLAVPVSIIGIATAVLPFPGEWNGIGDRQWRAPTVADVKDAYKLTMGNGNLDLRTLQLGDQDSLSTTVRVDVGNLEVYVPSNADVEITCAAKRGNVECLGHDESGSSSEVTFTDNGADGPGGGTIKLIAQTSMGNVEVHRG